MFKVINKRELAKGIIRVVVLAPRIAKKAQVGQFVVLRVDTIGERIPLTLVDWNEKKGTITLIFQEVGVSTKKLGALKVGDNILDVVGPLGNPAKIKRYGCVVIVGGGVGVPLALPRAIALKNAGNKVISIIGARTSELLILEDEMKGVSDELYVTTDDGSKGLKGFTSDVLRDLLEQNRHIDFVFAVGPVPMMRVIAEITRPYKLRTVVSLNPIMVDATGMCGACRVTVSGETKFTCVDGPEFDAHLVDFKELAARLRMYLNEEDRALKYYRGSSNER